MARTEEQRRKRRERRRENRRLRKKEKYRGTMAAGTPLFRLAQQLHRIVGHAYPPNHDPEVWRAQARVAMDYVPRALLEEAMVHLELRLLACPQNHQGRCTQTWLGRWQALVMLGLSRSRES